MIDILILVALFIVSFMLATLAIRLGIPSIRSRQQLAAGQQKVPIPLPESAPGGKVLDFASNGFWIGFFETFLVFVFVYEREYGALAIIIAAKEFVRRGKIEEAPSYYLLGTFVNLSVAMIFALLARKLLA